MAARLGNVLYWLGCAVAIVLALLGVLILFGHSPGMAVFLFVPAAVAWGLGAAARYVLSGSRNDG